MKLDFALNVLKEEYVKNSSFSLDLVKDKLIFLVALTKVEESLSSGMLKESEYISKVIGDYTVKQ